MSMKPNFSHITLCIVLVFCAVLTVQNGYAHDHLLEDSYEKHLTEINAEWKNYKNSIPLEKISFKSDEDRIQLHLFLVVDYLSQNTPQNISKSQQKKRLELTRALKKYAQNKIFPTNKFHLKRTPYFVDDYGVHCAVGYLMAYSGHSDLVAAIRKEHNYDYIKDIRTSGVTEWASTYGFTVDELKWIQPGYPPSETLEPISNGANGSVSQVYTDNYNGGLLIIGEFDSLDLFPCLNIGTYQNNQLSCLGNGIDGTIRDVLTKQNEVIVFGAFEFNGEIFPIAKFANGIWSYMGIPNRQNATCTAAYNGTFSYKYEIAISHSSIPNKQEIWYLNNQDVWEKKAMVTGEILDIAASGLGRIYAGHFDTTYRFDAFGIIDSTINANNVIINEPYSNTWSSIGSEISDTVKAIHTVGNNIYFAGSCSNSSSQDDVFLSRYLNNDLQPILLRSHFSSFSNISINSMTFNYNTSELIFGGDFELNTMMTFGKNLARYDPIYNTSTPMAILNAPVNSVTFSYNEIYIGGDFTTNLGNQNMNHLAKISPTSGISETESKGSIVVSPNPFINEITILGASIESQFVLLNASGQILQSGDLKNNKVSNLEKLPKGFYILKLTSMDKEIVHRLFK